MAYKVPTEKKARMALLECCDIAPDRWRDQALVTVCAALLALRDRHRVHASSLRLVTYGGESPAEIVECHAEDLPRQVAHIVDDLGENPEYVCVWKPAAIKLTHKKAVTYELTGTDLFKETD